MIRIVTELRQDKTVRDRAVARRHALIGRDDGSARLRSPGLAAAGFVAALAACQSAAPGPGPLELAAEDAALPAMERIALAANRCWFKSGDRAFAAYRLAPELDSFSGRPRILLVARDRPEERPLGVISAEGDPARVEAFGPIMDRPVGIRVAADVRRWAAGDDGCSLPA